VTYNLAVGCKSHVYHCRLLATVETVLLHVGVTMEILLHSNGDLQDSTVALVIDVRNVWEVSMEGSQTHKHRDLHAHIHTQTQTLT
jgi:hypothetical protein